MREARVDHGGVRPDPDADRDRLDASSGARLAVRAKARLPLIGLLAVLAGVALYGVPKIAQAVSGMAVGPDTATGAGCQLPPVRSPLKWSLAQLDDAVTASGLKSLAGDGTADVQGRQEPNAAWSDAYPVEQHSSDPSITLTNAGYELRWWSSRRDHQAADLFVFRSAADAARYARRGASTRCRRRASS